MYFSDLMQALTEAPVMTPDFIKSFKVQTDASQLGLGVLLTRG